MQHRMPANTDSCTLFIHLVFLNTVEATRLVFADYAIFSQLHFLVSYTILAAIILESLIPLMFRGNFRFPG